MDQWRSHIPSNNLPKQFCEWSFEQGDRKWQQDELVLGFELVSDVCGRKKECVVAGISGGKPPWAHKAGGVPRALDPRGHMVGPPSVFSVPNILKYSRKKSYLNFRAFGELLFSGYFLYCTDNSENKRKVLFFALFIANFCFLGDHVLELACQIYMVKSSFDA